MPFSPGFGARFGEQLGTSLANVIDEYAAQRKRQKQSQLLSQLLAPPGQQQGIQPQGVQQQEAGPSLLPVPLGQVLAKAQEAGLSPQQLQLIEHEYKRREDAARQQQRQAQQEEQLGVKKKKLELEEERIAGEQSKGYRDDLRERIKIEKPLYTQSKRGLELLKKPNVQIGPIKSLTPDRAQNADTQELVAILNELVTLKSQLGKGVPHRERLKLEQLSKAATWQKPETIKRLLSSIEKSTGKTVREDKIQNQIIEEHDNRIPRGFKGLVERRLQLTKGLPKASKFPEGTIIESGGRQFEMVNRTWKPLGR